MADTTPGLDAIPEDVSVKSGTKAKPTIANESVLTQMQDLYKQKQAEKNYFLQDLADASAWWSGGAAGPTEGLAKRAAVRAMQTKELQDLQAGIAGQQNALQNRDAFFGSGNLSGLPAGKAPTQPTSQVNVPQARAGAQELNQRTGGLLGLIRDPALQTALGYEYLSDPTKATSGVVSFLAKQAEDPVAIKEIRFAIQNGFIDPKVIPAAILTKIFPPGVDVKEVLTPSGEKTKATGFQIAGGYTGAGAPTTQAPVVAPTTPGAAPSTPAAAPSAPTTAPSANVTRAPIQATTQVAGRGGLNPQQTEVLGGLVTPGTEQAGDVIKAAAMAPIQARQKGLEKEYTLAADEGILVNQNYLDAGSNKTDAMTLKELANKAAPSLGVFQKAGPAAAAMTVIDSGLLKLGPLGTISAPLEEVAARLVPGAGPETIKARERIVGLLANQELAVARMNKGQGSWTELERNIIRGITGTVKNSKEFLVRRAELLEAKADFDEKLGQAAKDWLRANRGKSYYDFKQDSDEYENIVKEYRKTLRDRFANEFIKGQNMPSGVSKDTQNILNAYPSGKKEGTK